MDAAWKVVLINDDTNIMPYVTHVLMQIFSITREAAHEHMREAHETGRSVLWSGVRERAEHYVLLLNQWHLQAELEQDQP
jgi:ATP-dependent Clp protease adaptor protein ClpS